MFLKRTEKKFNFPIFYKKNKVFKTKTTLRFLVNYKINFFKLQKKNFNVVINKRFQIKILKMIKKLWKIRHKLKIRTYAGLSLKLKQTLTRRPKFFYYLYFSKSKNNYRIHLLDSKFKIKISETSYSATKFPGRQSRSKFALQKTFEKICAKLRLFFRNQCFTKARLSSKRQKRFRLFTTAPLFNLFIVFNSRLYYFEKFIFRYIVNLIQPRKKKQLFYVRFRGYTYLGKTPFHLVRAKHRRRRKRRTKRRAIKKTYISYKIRQFNKVYFKTLENCGKRFTKRRILKNIYLKHLKKNYFSKKKIGRVKKYKNKQKFFFKFSLVKFNQYALNNPTLRLLFFKLLRNKIFKFSWKKIIKKNK